MPNQPTKDRFSDPTVVFRNELAKIKTTSVKRAVLWMLRKSPEEFWYAPSSYSGRYHSPDEFGIGGQVLHTKRVFYQAMVLSDAAYEEMDTTDRDILYAAALVHDTLAGSTGSGDHVSTFVEYYYDRDYTHELIVSLICQAVEQHAGRWTPEPLKLTSYTEEMEFIQTLLHYADMIATKNNSTHILKEKDYPLPKPTGKW